MFYDIANISDVDASLVDSPGEAYDSINIPVKDAVKLYKKAILQTLAIFLGPVMEGYDVILLGSFFGLDKFADKWVDSPRICGQPTHKGHYRYASPGVDGTKVISAAWQFGISCGMLVSAQCVLLCTILLWQIGCIVGLTLNSMLAEQLGYKFTLLGSLLLTCLFICLTFFAENIATIKAGAVLIGIPWFVYSYSNFPLLYHAKQKHRGVFQNLSLTYIAEVIPICLCGYMATSINLCLVTGQLIASGVIRAFSTRTDEWSYQLLLGLRWAWPPHIIVFTIFSPESPWWLERQGRVEDAKKSLRRLTFPTCGIPNRGTSII